MDERERFNLVRWDGSRQGFYEVYYLKWNDPASETAGWLRYFLLSPKSGCGQPYCELFGIFFDARDPAGHFALKQRYPIERLKWDGNRFQLDLADAHLSQSSCRGGVIDSARGHELTWDLELSMAGQGLVRHPYDQMYSLPFPKTKVVSPISDGRFTGTLLADGRTIHLDSVKGMQGHLWGTQHGWRWAWGHCNTFEEDPEAVWEGLDAQVALGPWISPPLKVFYLYRGGRWYRFDAPRMILRNGSDLGLGRWRFEAQAETLKVVGTAEGPLEDFVSVTYTDTDGSNLWCNNTKIANLRLQLYEPSGREVGQLTSRRGCALEFVDRKIQPEIPVWI